MNLSKFKLIVFILVILTAAFFVLNKQVKTVKPSTQPSASENQSQSPRVVSTNPDLKDEPVLPATQVVEVTFNKPLVNDPNRVIVDPKVKFKIDLSADHKTMKLTPLDVWELGQFYTLTIKSGYGFDTQEKLDQDITFHFNTIKYRGV